MGSKASKSSFSKRSNYNNNNKHHLQTDIHCPGCNILFEKNTPFQFVKAHVGMCLGIGQGENNHDSPVSDFIIGADEANKIKQIKLQDYIYEKIPQNLQKTKFKWQKQPILQPNHQQLISLSPQQAMQVSFQEKNYWFRYHLQKKRISWTNGADYMKIEKTNVLMSSLIAYSKVNMHKQVKIQFIGDKVNDAGGLLREWVHMLVKQVFDQQTGIMTIANTDDIMYKLKWDEDLDEQFSVDLFTLFGTILGKAIFEKIPILSYLDRTILRHLTGRQLRMQDIYGYDKDVIYSLTKIQLYQSWRFILQNDINSMGLETYFTVNKLGDQTVKQIELVENGKDIEVTDQNKNLYVESCMEHLCLQAVKKSITAIKNGFYKVIPQNLICAFQPYEMEMLLYGVPYIDVNDWRSNTDYKGVFNAKHPVITWFWSQLEEFDQEKLANFLHFCTGSSRTPIQGFKRMQSNRGNVGKFLIESSPFQKKNPFPKGHTCFNRLQLPIYPTKQLLHTYLDAVAKSHLDGVFGLD